MKMLYLIVLMSICIYSCKKGDTGSQGPAGPQGAQGVQGVKGENGTMIYSGNDMPTASLGVNGDFYFRLSNSTFYGPKTAAGWGTAISLRGSAGSAGSKILSGTDLPAVNLGGVGDFYFKSDQSLLFGPKTASGWGTGVNLRGATGATGTANVIYSGWQAAVRVKDSIMDGTNMRIAHLYAPRITSTVQSSAAVLVYLDYGGGTFPLPFTSRSGGRMSTINFKLKTNEIVIYRFVYDGGALLALGSQIRYRYVIIPGGVVATLKNKNINLQDPFAVNKALKELNF